MAKRTKAKTKTAAAPVEVAQAAAAEDPMAVDLVVLAKRINRHRLDLRMTWPAYARHMELPQSTIYKIAQGSTTRPHALTVDLILQKLAAAVPVGLQ